MPAPTAINGAARLNGTGKPKALALKVENIPAELRKLDQFVCWRYEAKANRSGEMRYTKVPMRPDGRAASTTDARTWSSFADCVAAYEDGRADGVGFVTSGADPYTLSDLDHVIDRQTGAIVSWANEIIEAAKAEGAYVELSPSATGVHIFGKGPQRFDGRKANDAELYCRERFFTLSGWPFPGAETRTIGRIEKTFALVQARMGKRATPKAAPGTTGVRPYRADMTDAEILERYAFPSANGARLKKLLAGDVSDYPSASEAELACASDLAFWFWLDPVAIERVMRDSDLARDKWDENQSYLTRTIKTALAGKTDYYGKAERPDTAIPTPATGEDKAKPFDFRDHIQPVQELIDTPPPAIEFLLPGWLARGASSLLIGRPKNYKSWLSAQISLALAGNAQLLEDWAQFSEIARSYRIAVIDYEQSAQIAAQSFARFNVKKATGLLRLDAFPKLDEAGIEVLRKLIAEEGLDMVIIDSLTRMAPPPPRGSVFAAEGELMQRVTNLAHTSGAHILTIAHQGKRDAADDPMVAIAGTNALPASVDDVAVLFKEGDDDGATIQRKLFVSGRNVSLPGTYVLEKIATDARFVLKGSEETYVRGETKRRILALLGGGAAMGPTELAQSLGRDKGQVHRAVAAMTGEGLIVAAGGGKYRTRTFEAARRLHDAANRKERRR